MADEPRRSGRATKGQHKHASPSPAPAPKSGKATPKSKPSKKSQEPEQDEDGDDDVIRCICGNTNPKDKRAFIGCDACTVWQHNVCMGIPDDEDDVPEHYFCEECRPEEHQETLQALAAGEKIWDTRNKIYQSEKKASKSRKGKSAAPLGWLRKEVPAVDSVETDVVEKETSKPETGSKRKREEAKEEPAPGTEDEKPTRGTRQDKRRKSSAPAQATPKEQPAADPETSVVSIDKLPADRQKIATALSKIIMEVTIEMAKSAYQVPEGETPKSLGDKYASLIEYELHMTHGGPPSAPYLGQFRALNANLKKNKVLVERLLSGSLTANDLATMESKDMASEELQKERAAMKEQLDRQAIAVQEEGPRYRRTHKGDELIEDENQHLAAATPVASQPVRERVSVADGEEDAQKNSTGVENSRDVAGSPMQMDPPPVQTSTTKTPGRERRQSSQNFDMSNIWAKTAGSPTAGSGPRTGLGIQRRRSSMAAASQDQPSGTKHDADVDRMLQDDDEPYSPGDTTGQEVVWRGRLVQTSDGAEPTVNARWVAGRDITPTVSWRALMPDHVAIDGRLQIPKAEEYLCSLQWSNSSDVTVLALTPYDDAEAFTTVFQYFKSRERYAVVNKDKPPMVKDMYIIPLEAGANLPEHIGMLEHCTLKSPVEERMLLASLVVARAPGTPPIAQESEATNPTLPTNGNQQSQPQTHAQPLTQQHVRAAGPAASPMAPQNSMFSPTNAHATISQQQQGPGSPAAAPAPPSSSTTNPMIAEVLGTLQFAPTAQQILSHDPAIDRERLLNLRRILEEDPLTRTNINALAVKLQVGL